MLLCLETTGRTVTIKSNPAGAKIYINNVSYGTTLAIVTLPTYIYGGNIVTLKKKGYEDISYNINSSFQFVGLLNIFFWPGFIIDGATGNIIKINPNSLNIDLDLSKEENN